MRRDAAPRHRAAFGCALVLAIGCGGSDGESVAGSTRLAKDPPYTPYTYDIVVKGHGTVVIWDQTVACADVTCKGTIQIDPLTFAYAYVDAQPADLDWGLSSVLVDGKALGTDGAITTPGDHTVEVDFVELPACTPNTSSTTPPTLRFVPREMCAGHTSQVWGSDLSNGPNAPGACVYLRTQLLPATMTPIGAPSYWTGDFGLTVNLPAGFPDGPAPFVVKTSAGVVNAQTATVTTLPNPVITSITPNPAHANDVLAFSGKGFDHVIFIFFEATDITTISGVNGVSAPDSITYPLAEHSLMPDTYTVHVETACGASAGVPLEILP